MAQQVRFVRVQVTLAAGVLMLYKSLWRKSILGLGSKRLRPLVWSEKKLLWFPFGCHSSASLKELSSS